LNLENHLSSTHSVVGVVTVRVLGSLSVHVIIVVDSDLAIVIVLNLAVGAFVPIFIVVAIVAISCTVAGRVVDV